MSETEMNNQNELIVKAEDSHHDVGIVGLWYGLNYGSILTYYALYRVVHDMGYSVIMVNKPEVLWRPIYASKDTVANRFIYKYCDNQVTQCYHNSQDYKILNDNIDTFIVGSDVVWNYPICGKGAGQFFFLDFVEEGKKKIAMASSFGSGFDGPEEARVWSEHFLKQFDYIGVRENEAVNICQETFHVNADKIMDPVFLCDRQIYHDLAAQSEVNEENKYISSYFLGPNQDKGQMILKIAEILGCEYRCLPNPNNPTNFTKKTGLEAVENPSVEDWLKYFQNTQCYIGDSFHGLCFSIIFGRPFVCIVNKDQSLARFRTLLKTIGLENRMINLDLDDTTPEVLDARLREILSQEIDYEKVWATIDEKAKESFAWLENAIKSEKTLTEEQRKNILRARNPKMGDTLPATVAGVPDDICTGCSACMNVCPKDAISMQENEEGFIMPSIDPEKCVQCGKCIDQCPAVNTILDNRRNPEVYAAVANDEIRIESSSGGMFTMLAEKILEDGGYVCGASMEYQDGSFEIVHRIVDSKDKLAPLRKSKYAQSNIHLIYREIKKLLDEGKTVLFTGTPCQVAGLKSFLPHSYDHLYMVDILCHGVPSQHMLHQYIDEIAALPEVCAGEEPPRPTEIIFRDKLRYGWRSSTHIRVEFDNGVTYEGNLKEEDPFENVFHNKLCLRKSCGDCLFCSFPRQGDLSIGDFWGIQSVDPEMTDGNGTSLVFPNNSKGKKLFEAIAPKLAKSRHMPLRASEVKRNRIRALYPASPLRPRFMELLKRHTLTESVRLTNNHHYEVGLAVNHYAINFGGALTHYALYHVLEDLGYSTLMIERPKSAKNLESVSQSVKKIHLQPLYPSYAVAKSYRDKDEMRKALNDQCDMFMIGSDKLLNYFLYTALDKYTSLSWVKDSKKKIAYSASFGRTFGDPKVHAELGYFLQKFDHFSCREDSGVETAKNVYGVKDPEWVLDPVFLCDMKHYQTLIDRCTRQTPEKFVSAYILDPNDEKAAVVRAVRDRLGCECESFSEYERDASYYAPLGDLYHGKLKTEERLQSIADCDFFVTDSFHGMCFAILMKKPFFAIVNERRGAPRFYAIAKMLHLEDRLIADPKEFDPERISQPIDYDKVYETLNQERSRCLNWLKNALAAPKRNIMSDYDKMCEIAAAQDKKLANLKELILSMTSNLSDTLAGKNDIMDYLDELGKNAKGNIVVISVKDTPGLAMDSFIVNKLYNLGLRTDLVGKHGHSYVAVLNGGKVIFEKLGANEDPVVYEKEFGTHSLFVTSRVYRNGNEAIIKINGKDYSVNKRGLNIVVYNKQTRQLVDSVAFDTHVAGFDCSRK